MTCIHRIAAIKNEADTYLSQGLHGEAAAVYDQFVRDNPKIDPTLRTAIENHLQRIKSEARNFNRDEALNITDREITLIKKGWRSQATSDELLVSARALADLGCYEYALEELRLLLVEKILTAPIIKGVARCLVHLEKPTTVSNAVDHFSSGIFKHPRNRLAFKLAIAKSISSELHPHHHSALCHHLAKSIRNTPKPIIL